MIEGEFPPRVFLNQRVVGFHLLIQPRTVSKRRRMFRTYVEIKKRGVLAGSEDL